MTPKGRNIWKLREDTLVLVAMTGPAIAILSMIFIPVIATATPIEYQSEISVWAWVPCTFVGFVVSIAWIVHRWNKGRPRRLWYLLLFLNFLLVVPLTILLVSGKFG